MLYQIYFYKHVTDRTLWFRSLWTTSVVFVEHDALGISDWKLWRQDIEITNLLSATCWQNKVCKLWVSSVVTEILMKKYISDCTLIFCIDTHTHTHTHIYIYIYMYLDDCLAVHHSILLFLSPISFLLNRCTGKSPADSDDTRDCIYTITT